jgi:hypothetical protein
VNGLFSTRQLCTKSCFCYCVIYIHMCLVKIAQVKPVVVNSVQNPRNDHLITKWSSNYNNTCVTETVKHIAR